MTAIGWWEVRLLLSFQQRGKSNTQRIKKWAQGGVTQLELDIAKTTLIGSYQVGFDTTYGLSSGILGAVTAWKDLAYIDNYPNKVKSVTLEQVNDAIKKYIIFEEIYEVAAGSIDEKGIPIKEQGFLNRK